MSDPVAIESGLTDLKFRMLPLQDKIRAGIATFADIYNMYTDQRVRLEPARDGLLWHIKRCPVCWQRKATSPVCHLTVGTLQEAFSWISGGKLFQVKETRCSPRARQAAHCTLAG